MYGGSLTGLFLRLALTGPAPASKAVLHAILAISSMQLSKESQASRYKASAISSLRASMKTAIDERVALQAIAASMLLCAYEVGEVFAPIDCRSTDK